MDNLNPRAKKNLKLFGAGLLLAIGVFAIANWNYLWMNTKYLFIKPTGSAPIQNATNKYEPSILIIENLGIKAPVQYVDTDSEQAFQAALVNGVVQYPGTPAPGQIGNDYIFGHSSDYLWTKGHYKTVFALLPKIKIGEIVQLSDREGNLFTYKIMATKIVAPDDLSVLSQDTGGRKILTLQTSYPVGTALKRFIVIGELVEDKP